MKRLVNVLFEHYIIFTMNLEVKELTKIKEMLVQIETIRFLYPKLSLEKI